MEKCSPSLGKKKTQTIEDPTTHLLQDLSIQQGLCEVLGGCGGVAPRVQLGGLQNTVSSREAGRQLTTWTHSLKPHAASLPALAREERDACNKDVCTDIQATLLERVKSWKQPRCSWAGGWRAGGLFMQIESPKKPHGSDFDALNRGWQSAACGGSQLRAPLQGAVTGSPGQRDGLTWKA